LVARAPRNSNRVERFGRELERSASEAHNNRVYLTCIVKNIF